MLNSSINQNNLISLNIGRDTASIIMTCMIHAHLMNIVNPGTYNTEMNKLLKANSLPSVILPDNPPSQGIINTSQRQSATHEEKTDPQPSTSNRPHPQPTTSKQQSTSKQSSTSKQT